MSNLLDPPGYSYHHGRGEHILVRPDEDQNRPRYSLHCCLCHCVDCLVTVFIVAFLVFMFWLPYYLYNNYGSGD